MIEVRLQLLDAHERGLFGQLMDILEAKREGRLQEMAPPHEPKNDNPVIAHIEPDPDGGEPTVTSPVPEAPKVEEHTLEAVVMQYIKAKGLVETRKRIAEFGYPQLAAVPAEKRAELKAMFEGWLAE